MPKKKETASLQPSASPPPTLAGGLDFPEPVNVSAEPPLTAQAALLAEIAAILSVPRTIKSSAEVIKLVSEAVQRADPIQISILSSEPSGDGRYRVVARITNGSIHGAYVEHVHVSCSDSADVERWHDRSVPGIWSDDDRRREQVANQLPTYVAPGEEAKILVTFRTSLTHKAARLVTKVTSLDSPGSEDRERPVDFVIRHPLPNV